MPGELKRQMNHEKVATARRTMRSKCRNFFSADGSFRFERLHPGPHELAQRMSACGLQEIRYVLTAGGIIAIHAGRKPA